MAGYIPTGKALMTARIDVGSANKAWSDRYNLRGADFCVNPCDYNRDWAGRMADPYTLNRKQEICNNIDPDFNVQQFMIRENNLERPWLNPVFLQTAYDTMGVGRTFQQPRAGCGNDGSWWQINGSLASQPQTCNDVPAPQQQPRGQCNTLGGSLSRLQYNG